jgi:hypothetical protein
MTGLLLHTSLQSDLPFCVHEFCAVALQFSSQSCMHSSSGDNEGFASVTGVGSGAASTIVFCGTLASGSSAGSSFGASICLSTTGFVITSCVAGAQLIRKINAKNAHFIVKTS